MDDPKGIGEKGREGRIAAVIAGFEPFGGRTVNLSQKIVEAWGPREDTIKAVLPVRFDSIEERVRELLTHRPRLVLILGESGGRTHLAVEEVGLNLLFSESPDNAGDVAPRRPLIEGAPLALLARWDGERVARFLADRGERVQRSFHAGTYACNQALYLSLHHSLDLDPLPAVGMIHVPARGLFFVERRARRLALILQDLVDQLLLGRERA